MKLSSFVRCLVLCAALVASPAAGQVPAGGSVSGTVVDADGAQPLADAGVALEPRGGGAPPRTTRTDAAGRYRFTGVEDGDYRVRVHRLGYRAASVEVVLRGGAAPQLSVGLLVQPVALEPIRALGGARAAAANPFGRRGADEDASGDARVEVERARQRAHLAPDVRAVTGADVEEGVTLAEADLLRAIQRLPGVAARDDYSAEVWTRGAPWDHTRVYWDGMPLYNPVHSLGIFSGVNTDAVGSVLFHPGVQPVYSAGGAAATLELGSRRGRARPTASAEASLVSARVAADGAAGRVAWMAAARAGFGGWLLPRIEERTRPQDVWATDRFADLATRVDVRLGGGATLEASALAQRDLVDTGPDTDWAGGEPPRWGSGAARVTLRARPGGFPAELTAGGSRFDAEVRRTPRDTIPAGSLFSWPTLFSARSQVRYAVLEGRVGARAGAAPWRAGASLVRQGVHYDGPPLLPRDLHLPPAAERRDDGLAYGSVWGEGRWTPLPRLALEGALRVDAGSRVPRGEALRWAPRAAARFQATPRATLSAAAGRSWQYLQAGPELGAQAFTQHSWLLAGRGVPALRSDVVTLGGEAWLGTAWLAAATLYERRSAGAAVMDPRPGPVLGRPDFVEGTMEAEGVELSVRRLAGRWTGSASYSWGSSTTRAEGVEYASGADQRHSVDVAARASLGRGFHLGGALTASTGGASNRFFAGIATCSVVVAGCQWAELPRAGEPGSVRAAPYASLDLAADWTRAFGPLRVTAFAQLRNALDRDNPARYNHSVSYAGCGFGRPVEGEPGCTDDVWSSGLPRIPVAGVRVSL
ncbi:MAG TPA: TonB-dependent receptor [Longimicrobium sp.]